MTSAEHRPPSALLPLQEIPGRPLVVAHRGASTVAPENTMAAFELAIDQGAHMIEVDAHLTADGHLVVHHDDTFERTTDAAEVFPGGAPWNVRDLTLAQVRELSAGQFGGVRQKVPTLAEVIQLVRERDVGLLIETKSEYAGPDLETAIAELVLRHDDWSHWVPKRLMICSFFPESLFRLRDALPDVNLAFIAVSLVAREGQVVEAHPVTPGFLEPGMTLAEVRDRLAHERIGYFGLAVLGINGEPVNDFTHDTISLFRESGVEVNFITDDPAEMRNFAAAGVTSLLTNHPDRLVEVLADLDRTL